MLCHERKFEKLEDISMAEFKNLKKKKKKNRFFYDAIKKKVNDTGIINLTDKLGFSFDL